MKKTRAIEGFDLLKIIFIPPQAFYHYQEAFGLRFNDFNFYGGRYDPNVIINLLFMVSGFLALHSLREDQQLLGGFFKKIIRLYPMAMLSTAAALLIKSIAAEDLSVLWNLRALLSNFFLFFVGWPGFYTLGYNHPCWYLCVLIQCYMVFYLLMWLRRKVKADWLLLSCAIVLLSMVLHKMSLLQYHSYRGIQAFFIGTVLCALKSKIPEKSKIALLIAVLSALLLAFVPESRLRGEIFIFYPALVMLCAWKQGCFRERTSRNLSLLSTVSFDLYLWHSPVIFFIKMIERVRGHAFNHSLWTMLLFFIVSCIISWFIYNGLDKPINRWISAKISRKKELVS